MTAISGQVVNVSVRLTWNVTTGGGGGGSAWLSNATLATLLIGTTGLLALAVVLLLARRRRPPEPETGELRVVAEPVEESEGLPETPADAVP